MWMLQQTLSKVFTNYRYVLLAFLVAFVTFAASLWMRNLSLIFAMSSSSLFDLTAILLVLLSLLGGIVTSISSFAAVLIVVVSILFGINVAMLAYYFVSVRRLPRARESTATLGSVVAAVFGVGCASCGTFILGIALSSVGASGVLLLLPYGGHELLVISAVLLIGSIYWIARSIQESNAKVCEEMYGKKS